MCCWHRLHVPPCAGTWSLANLISRHQRNGVCCVQHTQKDRSVKEGKDRKSEMVEPCPSLDWALFSVPMCADPLTAAQIQHYSFVCIYLSFFFILDLADKSDPGFFPVLLCEVTTMWVWFCIWVCFNNQIKVGNKSFGVPFWSLAVIWKKKNTFSAVSSQICGHDHLSQVNEFNLQDRAFQSIQLVYIYVNKYEMINSITWRRK